MRKLTKCFKITIILVFLHIITTNTQNLLSPYLLFWLRTLLWQKITYYSFTIFMLQLTLGAVAQNESAKDSAA